jgi:hypothetical protein
VQETLFNIVVPLRSFWQCCGTVMIYCGSGSGSYFRKVFVPVPDPDLLSIVFNNKKFIQNLAFSMLEAAMFP